VGNYLKKSSNICRIIIMKDTDIFQQALGLVSPWQVKSSTFDINLKQLDIVLSFAAGSKFTCPSCKQSGLSIHDTIEKNGDI